MATSMNRISPLRVIEFYSGVGGMHYALLLSKVPATVVAAIDINDIANRIYWFNFPEIKLLQRNIQSVSMKEFTKLDADMFLMSPPCQPFTRVGLKGDKTDPRTASFLYLLDSLPKLSKMPRYILVENVKGFETSETRKQLVQVLQSCNYRFKEFLLSPTHVGVPNQRLRYFLLAKLHPLQFGDSCLSEAPLLAHEIIPAGSAPTGNCDSNQDRTTLMSVHRTPSAPDGPVVNPSEQFDASSLGSGQPCQRTYHNGAATGNEDVGQSETSRGNKCEPFGNMPEEAGSVNLFGNRDCLGGIHCDDHGYVDTGLDSIEPMNPNSQSCTKSVERSSSVSRNFGELEKGKPLPSHGWRDRESRSYGESHQGFQGTTGGNGLQCNGGVPGISQGGIGSTTQSCQRSVEEASVSNGVSQGGIGPFLETLSEAETEEYLVTDKLLLRFGRVMDIVTVSDDKTCCFTKAYGHYIEGTGSFLHTNSSVSIDWAFTDGLTPSESLGRLRQLWLRYFTPREIANFHCFPEEFSFPTDITRKQRYRVLGNSLNAHVVSLLLKYLVS